MSKRGGQGRRERERSIRSLRRLIVEHEGYVSRFPHSTDIPHWLAEIAAFREQLAKHERRLGRGSRES